MNAPFSISTPDVGGLFANFFDLSLDDDDQAIAETVMRIATRHLDGLRVGTDAAADRAALASVHGLGLVAMALKAIEEPDIVRKLAIAAEELGVGHLEMALVGILPAAAALLLTGRTDCRESEALIEELVNRPGGVAIGTRDPVRASVVRCFGDRAATHIVVVGSSSAAEEIIDVDLSESPCQALDLGVHLLRFDEIMRAESQLVQDGCRGKDQCSLSARKLSIIVVLFSAAVIGGMQAAVDFAFKYARSRRSFGKPIIAHQAVALRLAHMLTTVEATKLMLWQTVSESERGKTSDGTASLLHQTQWASREIFRDCVQICGAHGYVEGTIAPWLFRTGVFANGILDVLARGLGVNTAGEETHDRR
jgi:hypothetical protein